MISLEPLIDSSISTVSTSKPLLHLSNLSGIPIMSVDIPKQQRAAVRQGSGEDASAPVQKVDVPLPGPGQILVKINWTGLCASDKSLIHDEWKDFGVAMMDASKGIAGHEGAGVVVAVGDGMDKRWKVGDRAGIKWIASTCGECEFCLTGTDEVHCVNQTNSGFSTHVSYLFQNSRHIQTRVVLEETARVKSRLLLISWISGHFPRILPCGW